MSASIARYLKDFGAPPPPVIVAEDQDLFTADLADFSFPAEEEKVDLEAERTAAHALGRNEAIAEMQQRFDEEKAALVEAHRHELEAQRVYLETTLADLLAAQLQEIAESIAEAVSDQTAQILAPLLNDAVTTKAVGDLAEQVRAAVAEGEVQVLTLRGPKALFDMLHGTLGDTGALRHIEAVDIDLVAELGDAAFVTRLSVWSANLKKVLG